MADRMATRSPRSGRASKGRARRRRSAGKCRRTYNCARGRCRPHRSGPARHAARHARGRRPGCVFDYSHPIPQHRRSSPLTRRGRSYRIIPSSRANPPKGGAVEGPPLISEGQNRSLRCASLRSAPVGMTEFLSHAKNLLHKLQHRVHRLLGGNDDVGPDSGRSRFCPPARRAPSWPARPCGR